MDETNLSVGGPEGEEDDFEVGEDMGYDVPFTTFTWARWQGMQVRMLQSFTRFQRAIEQRELQVAFKVIIELEQMTIELQKEASAWIGLEKKL